MENKNNYENIIIPNNNIDNNNQNIIISANGMTSEQTKMIEAFVMFQKFINFTPKMNTPIISTNNNALNNNNNNNNNNIEVVNESIICLIYTIIYYHLKHLLSLSMGVGKKYVVICHNRHTMIVINSLSHS